MTRIITIVVFLTLLQSCIVVPERWREEVFEAVANTDGNLEYDRQLVMFIFASGNEYDLHSPYGVSIRFTDEGMGAKSVTINSFSAVYDGQQIHDLTLRNLHSRSPVEFGSQTVDIDPAPCCLFWIASDKFELVHSEGETLTVRIDYCVVSTGERDCVVEERQFRAVVRKGNFTMGGV